MNYFSTDANRLLARDTSAAYLEPMTLDPHLERRVDRLETEVVAIYDLIRDETKDIRGVLDEHTQTLTEHSQTLAEHSQTLAEHTQTLAEHTQTLAEQSQTLDAHTQTLAEHGVALAEILRRLPEPSA